MVVVLKHGPCILIWLIPAMSVFSILARLSLLSAPMLVLLYVSYTVWLLFHDYLAHPFLNLVSSIFVLILHSLTAPIIARIGTFLCEYLGGLEICRHFQYWSEFIMWICLAFTNSVALLSWTYGSPIELFPWCYEPLWALKYLSSKTRVTSTDLI